MKKYIIGLFIMCLSVGMISALPDIVEGIQTIDPISASAGFGDVTNYVDGDWLTTAGNLNDVLLTYELPSYVQSGSFDYRVEMQGSGPIEYSAVIPTACLSETLEIRQSQFLGTQDNRILLSECFDGSVWVELDIVDISELDPFWNWYGESVSVLVKFKATDGISQEVIGGETYEIELGLFEEIPSSTISGIISETEHTLTNFVEFMGVNIWKDESVEKIYEFEAYGFLSPDVDWLSIERTDLFETSENVEIRGVTATWESYRVTDGVTNGFVVDANTGVSLLLVEVTEPTTIHLFSVYSDL